MNRQEETHLSGRDKKIKYLRFYPVIMGCGTSRSVETAVITSNEDHDKPSIRETEANGNVSATPNSLDNNNDRPVTEVLAEHPLTEASGHNQEHGFSVGDRVHVSGYVGTVKFIGELSDLGDGEWIGIELDRSHPQGHDGYFQGVQRFVCKPRHGLFVRPSSVFHHTDINAITETSSVSPQTITFIQTSMRRFLARIRLKRFQQRTGVEKKIDAHVLSTPEVETESVERLSQYLTHPWSGERHKAYAIFRWLSFNVAYDVEGFFGRTEKKQCDASSVLKHRTCVCAGYANLFEGLAKAAGLQAHIIEGYAKGYGFEPGQQFKNTNHAWNAIQVNREWFICEPTWGAGYLGNDLIFHRSPNVAMCLMDPEYAICSHYPADEQWQFLDQPISKEEFEKLVVPSGRIHEVGVELLSHKESIYTIEDADNIDMMFYSPSLKILRGGLKDSSGKELEGRKWTQVIPCGVNKVKLRAQFPTPGKFKLSLDVRDADSNNTWQHGIEYLVNAGKGVEKRRGGFPRLGNEFYEMGFYLDHPFENVVSEDGKACISLENYNSQISGVSGNLELEGKDKKLKKEFNGFTFCWTEKTNKGYQAKVHCPVPGEYTLNIFAKHTEEGRPNTYVCGYYITALAGVGPVPGFPRLSDRFDAWGLELIEPRENIHVPDGRAAVKIKTPDEIILSGHLMKGSQYLDNGLCFTTTSDGVSTVLIHAPEAGEFQLNIFGRKPGSKDSEYLSSLVIKADQAASLNPGFPYLKDEFKEWGLELVDHFENILSHESHVTVTLSHPSNISVQLFLFDAHNKQIGYSLPSQTADDKTTISCELPKPGSFKLNIFGTNLSLDSTKQTYLGSYKVLYQPK